MDGDVQATGSKKRRRVRLDQKLLDENNQAKITKRKSGRTFGGYINHNPPVDDGELLILALGGGLTETQAVLLKLQLNKMMCHSFFLFGFV